MTQFLKKSTILRSVEGYVAKISSEGKLAVEGDLSLAFAGSPVFGWMDAGPVLDTALTNIPGSGDSPLTVVAMLTQDVKQVRIADTTGYFIGVYENSTLRYVINPGQDSIVDVLLASGSAVSLRAIGSSAIMKGSLLVQFI